MIHYLNDLPILNPSQPGQQSGSMIFFPIQAVAITFEMFVAYLVRLAEGATGTQVPVRMKRWIGYVWVTGWFSMTQWIWIEPAVRAGFVEDGWHSPLALAISRAIKERAEPWLKFQ